MERLVIPAARHRRQLHRHLLPGSPDRRLHSEIDHYAPGPEYFQDVRFDLGAACRRRLRAADLLADPAMDVCEEDIHSDMIFASLELPMPRQALCLIALLLVAADWKHFLGPTRDGHSPETGLAREWPAGGPAKLWEAEIGADFSGPVVSGGKVLLFHRVGDEEVLQRWNAADGKPLWKYAATTAYVDDFGFDEGPRATPSVVDGRVYTLGAEGRLSCISLEGGKKVWERHLAVDYPFNKGYFGVAGSPLVDVQRVYINIGSKGAGVVAFDRATGKENWKVTDDEAGYSSPVLAKLD